MFIIKYCIYGETVLNQKVKSNNDLLLWLDAHLNEYGEALTLVSVKLTKG